jgi:hypothetical protein
MAVRRRTAWGPGDGDALLDIAPVCAMRTASVFQSDAMALGFNVDGGCLWPSLVHVEALSPARPSRMCKTQFGRGIV